MAFKLVSARCKPFPCPPGIYMSAAGKRLWRSLTGLHGCFLCSLTARPGPSAWRGFSRRALEDMTAPAVGSTVKISHAFNPSRLVIRAPVPPGIVFKTVCARCGRFCWWAGYLYGCCGKTAVSLADGPVTLKKGLLLPLRCRVFVGALRWCFLGKSFGFCDCQPFIERWPRYFQQRRKLLLCERS